MSNSELFEKGLKVRKEVLGEEFGIGTLAVVVVQNLAVAAPVCAEVEDDAFVLAAGGDHRGGDVGTGVGGLGVEVPVDHEDRLSRGRSE